MNPRPHRVRWRGNEHAGVTQLLRTPFFRPVRRRPDVDVVVAPLDHRSARTRRRPIVPVVLVLDRAFPTGSDSERATELLRRADRVVVPTRRVQLAAHGRGVDDHRLSLVVDPVVAPPRPRGGRTNGVVLTPTAAAGIPPGGFDVVRGPGDTGLLDAGRRLVCAVDDPTLSEWSAVVRGFRPLLVIDPADSPALVHHARDLVHRGVADEHPVGQPLDPETAVAWSAEVTALGIGLTDLAATVPRTMLAVGSVLP